MMIQLGRSKVEPWHSPSAPGATMGLHQLHPARRLKQFPLLLDIPAEHPHNWAVPIPNVR